MVTVGSAAEAAINFLLTCFSVKSLKHRDAIKALSVAQERGSF